MTADEYNSLVLECADMVRRIEHGDRHTWESCHEGVRKRALLKANAVINLLMERGWKPGMSARELREKFGSSEQSEGGKND